MFICADFVSFEDVILNIFGVMYPLSYVSKVCENLMRLFIIIDSYVVNGFGIEFRWGRGFLCPFRLVLRPTKPPVVLQKVSPLFSGVKRSGRVADYQPPSTAKVACRLEL